jgi:predicted HD superfamily hydrolase involved in NAD metabolism
MPLAKMPRYKEFLQCIRGRLPDEKVSHCIFVAEYAASLSAKAGVPHDEIVTAGMLHDLCRVDAPDLLLSRARGYGIDISEAALEFPMLLHGPVAAEECREDLGIWDDDVYEAIYWHTTGRPGLGRTGQLLFVADFSEPTRKFPEAAEARVLAREEGFESALRYVARTKLYFQRKKDVIDPNLEDFLHWIEQEYPA